MSKTKHKNRRNFLGNTFIVVGNFCLKLKNFKNNNSINILENIKNLDLPLNIKNELLAKFYDENYNN